MEPELKDSGIGSEERLASLDALRGFDMFWIIGGGWIVDGLGKGLGNKFFEQYILPQTRHARWEGFTCWDLIMPLFLFVVGVAMPFSFAKRLGRGDSKGKLYFHIVIRAVILWVLGMVAQGRLLEYDMSHLRLYSNTLQAIAAGYLIAALISLNMRLAWQIVATSVLLLVFWGLMMLVPVPGHGAGVLTEDGNLAIYIDKAILGSFQDGTTYTWILSSMTFGATVMMGLFAGELLHSKLSKTAKVLGLLGSGIGCILLGAAWGLVFPIIKHIWTSSFVLFSGGLCLLLLGVFYLLIDVWGFRKWAFGFVVIGINAIAVYMVTRVFDFRTIADIFVKGLAKWTGDWHDFARAVSGVLVVWLILFWMYRKKSFVKI
jgi:predicted acyltransferase